MYASTKIFQANPIVGTRYTGWAAPETGSLCVCLGLYADTVLVAATKADEFSAKALKAGVRDGWCSFELELFSRHFVLSDELSVRCMTGNNELDRIHIKSVESNSVQAEKTNLVEDLIKAQLEPLYTDVLIFEPIIRRMAATLSAEEFVSFAYQLILHRKPDHAGLRDYAALARADAMKVFSKLMSSDEYVCSSRKGLSGPFSHNFPQLPVFD